MRPVLVGLMLAGLLPGAVAALTPGEKCEADKLKVAGKYAFCRMKAESKAVKTGGPADYSKCDEKYGAKWALIETKASGTCPVTGDVAPIGTQATECTDELTAAIGGTPPPGCVGELLECEDEVVECEEDLAIAELCGNGAIDAGEDCDLGTLNGETCATQGFTDGVLSCGDGCVFDTAGCWDDRFVDNADGTITDNKSGLMWEKKTERNGATNFANAHDADNFYHWSGTCTVLTSKRCQPTAAASALCAASVEGDPDGCSECTGGEGTCNQSTTIWTVIADRNGASFAGYSDWRAPTLQELLTLMDYADTTPPAIDVAFQGASCGAACTDITDPACSCTQSGSYWSASTHAPGPLNAWIVNFNGGGVGVGNKPGSNLYVRAVRGGS